MENSTLNNQFANAIGNESWANIYDLIEQGADIKMTNNWPIRLAAKRHNLPLMLWLIHKGVNVYDNGGFALRWIFENCPFSTVKFLYKCR